MAQQQRPPEREQYEQRYEGNGLAHDMKQEMEKGAEMLEKRYGFSPEVQGYILMTAGTILLLFSVGLFPILKWVMVAASIVMVAVGAYRSDFFRSLSHSIERMRQRR